MTRTPGSTLSRIRATTFQSLLVLGIAGCGSGVAQTEDAPDSTATYTTERVSFNNNDTMLSGILWLPPYPGPHPALVLVDGSGKTTAEKWTPWMNALTGLGVACLSYDKRGVGGSEGTYRGGVNIDVPLLASDAVAGVDYLKSRAEVDASQIGLLGVSQAGWIIPAAATTSRDVAFTVIFSGTTVSVGEENYYSQLTGADPFWGLIYRNLGRDEISRRLAEKGPSKFDPLPHLKRMTVPGLWLFGALDASQPTRESTAILDRLIEDHGKGFTYVVFEGADHSIMIGERSAPGVMDTMKVWISRQIHVAGRPRRE